MSYPEYFRARAEEAERKALQAQLPRVRELYLQAAATWTDMALKSERAEMLRRSN
jgi:hypothetical protein